MAKWLWLKGIPGPPANDDWFELISYSLGGSSPSAPYGGERGQGVAPIKAFSVIVPSDSRSSQFFQALVNSQVMEVASLFFEPQTQYVFSRCMFNNVSTEGGKDARIAGTLSYESFTIDYGT